MSVHKRGDLLKGLQRLTNVSFGAFATAPLSLQRRSISAVPQIAARIFCITTFCRHRSSAGTQSRGLALSRQGRYTNTIPTLSPRRHLTRAPRPLEFRDSNKSNVLGMSPGIDNRAPVSERSMTVHGWTANPPSARIQAPLLIDLRADFRCSFRLNID